MAPLPILPRARVRRSPAAVALRRALALTAVLLPLATQGCGDGGPPPGPPTGAPAASCGLAGALHEHQLQGDATLRAALATSVVGRLETSSGVPHAKDSGGPGSDAIAYRIAEATTLRLTVAPGAVARTRLVDAAGATVAEAHAGGAAVAVDVTPGEYTLVVHGDDSRQTHYLVQPETCLRGDGRASARVASTAANFATPGVYIQELPDSESIVQAPTSVTAFVGAVGSGPVGQPRQLLGPSHFAATFGAAAGDSLVGRAVAQFFASGGDAAWVVGTTGTTPAELLGSGPGGGGVGVLGAEVSGWSLLVLPDVATLSPEDATTVIAGAVEIAAELNAFMIVDPPLALGDVAAVTGWASGSLLPALPAGLRSNAAVYWPPLQVEDASGATVTMGAAGAVAGLYASSDAESDVWHQPTGSIVGGPGTTISLPVTLDDTDAGTLSAASINALRGTPQGAFVAEARTLAGMSEDFRYVACVRTDLMLRTSITQSLQWVVFEPDDETLWASVTTTVSTFLASLWQEGAFFGDTAAEAFDVTCDESNNPPQQILLGLLGLDVAVALGGPGEMTLQAYTIQAESPSS